MQPKRWLQAISRYKATSTVAPNFAYQLCIERIKDNIVDELDLRSIKFAWVGAEPVRRTTLINFSHKFAKTGFKTSAFYPCYGMAEATLFVSGGDYRELPRYALQNDNGSYTSYDITTPPKQTHCKEFVSCGKASLGQEIIIADSQSFIECEEGKTGEIFLTGQSIVNQYWGNICSDTFVTPPGLGDTTYMATGDIGFIQNNELYITGRKKNMIIMAGRNIYAEDIEYCVEKACSAITKGGVAAFSVDNGHKEELIIVAELSSPLRRAQDQYNALQNETFLHARTAIKHNIDIVLNQLILLRKGRLPRTSSGKIQHQQCKQLFLDNQWVNH